MSRAREPYLHAISHWCGLVHLVMSYSYDLENGYFNVFHIISFQFCLYSILSVCEGYLFYAISLCIVVI